MKQNNEKKTISLAEAAIELKTNKSKLAFYYRSGLFEPVDTISRVNVFDRSHVITRFALITKLKKSGQSLKQIKKTLNNDSIKN